MRTVAIALLSLLASLAAPALPALQGAVESTSLITAGLAAQTVPESAYQDLSWRNVGPYRGGRSTAVSGFHSDADRWIMGTTGGGIWETTDNGAHWRNISDGWFGGSIGAVAVAASDQNVIYVGQGSVDIRGNTSHGRGMWKSMDGGETWEEVGLTEAGQIGRIEVHPRDHDLVYVAALGHAFGKNPERGIFRSRDGGATWEHILALSDSTGASDLTMDPTNPRILYAGMWRGERKPWTLISGSEEAGVYRSVDGGDTWEKLGGGLPGGMVGKVGVSVSPADPRRVWAIVEAEPEGGVYRSDDRGRTWTRTNSENKLRQRAWYYTHVQADPRDKNTVYALNTSLYRSVDGGTTFTEIPVPHGDVHDLWIHPDDPDRMVVANDGGGQVTVNAGDTWSTYYNQPTAELYDVAVDNGFPYRLYGAQQDNTTISVPAWSDVNTLYPKEHWQNVGGCETGPVALHPDYPEIVYAGCYGGVMDRYDLSTGQRRNVMLYPELQLGMATRDLKHRFQWVSPMVVSRHDPRVLYHGSQFVNRSSDEGATWETVSPDLTTNNPEHQDQSGGPINADVTGVEIYNTVFSIAESPVDPGEVWAGTDDGRVHLTRDNAASWRDITPRGMPDLGTVDEIELSAHRPGRAWIAVQRYRMDDFAPYIFRTDDWGGSWELVTDGIPGDSPVRTVREDPETPGLLFAGTEFGAFVSFNAGDDWQPLQLNLPVTPVTGMRVAHGDLIVSTQGRSFWVMDDITPLQQLAGGVEDTHLFQPRDAYRLTNLGGNFLAEFQPEPRLAGARMDLHLATVPEGEVRIEVVDEMGRVAATFSTDSALAAEEGNSKLELKAGHNRVVWAPFFPPPELPEGAVPWGYTGGIVAPPGRYTARLRAGDEVREAGFTLLPDPRIPEVTMASYRTQFETAVQVRDSISAVARTIDELASIREQVANTLTQAEAAGQRDRLAPLADTLTNKATGITEELMQTRNRSGQDPIRFPPRLDNQLLELYGRITGTDGYISGGAEGAPQAGTMERLDDVFQDWAVIRGRYLDLLREELQRFNAAVQELGLPAIILTPDGRLVS